MNRIILIVLLPFLAFAASGANDMVVMDDGHGFTGKIKSIRNCMVKLKWEKEVLMIPLDRIAYIEFEDPDDKVALDFMAMEPDNKCYLGRKDAEMYHGKYGGHVVLGIFFGPFAMLGTALAQPYPYRGRHTPVMSENKELFNDPEYAECYKRRAKGRLIGAEAIGWGAWILFILIISS